MAGPADILREIHRLRSYSQDLTNSLESGPRRIKAQQIALTKAEEEMRVVQDAIKKLKVNVHEHETSVKGVQEQIKKYEKQLSDITSKKEYDALRAEIAAAREKIKKIEDQALTAMLAVDEKSAEIPAAEQRIKAAKADYAAFEREFQSKVANWTAERDKTLREIDAVEGQLPPEVRPEYDRVIKAMGADALASVEGPNCTACYTELTAQNQHNLAMKQFMLCRACGRLIYLKT